MGNPILLILLIVYTSFYQVFGLSLSGKESKSLEEFYYSQPLDHFGKGNNLSTIMFNRYFVDRTYWTSPKSKSPLLVYFGGEDPVDFQLQKMAVINEGAKRFGSPVMYLEHRFYGKSVPFGSIDIAMGDREVRACLTSEQALMDFAEILLAAKKNVLAPNTPIFVIGCSYSGFLAAHFRLKFSDIASGAIASSAPIFFFDMNVAWENEYCAKVSHDFKIVNEKCYNRIIQSWDMIINTSLKPGGLDDLTKKFNTCSPLLNVNQLTSTLVSLYFVSAQYNGRFNGLINGVCDKIARAPNDDILGAIASATFTTGSCFQTDMFADPITVHQFDSNTKKAWDWQLCSEFIIRQGCGKGTMFQPKPYNITEHINYCWMKYSLRPPLDWVSTYYGGYDMRLVLKNFGSNIIFSNGLMDPYSTFGVLEDLSETMVALTTKKGSHCLDMGTEQPDDPKWLTHQRKKEIDIIARWIQDSHYSNRVELRATQSFFLWFTLSLASLLLL